MRKLLFVLMCMMAAAAHAQNNNGYSINLNGSTGNRNLMTNETASQFSNDRRLLNIYNNLGDTSYKKKSKAWRIAGYISSGVLCVGIFQILTTDEKDYYNYYAHFDEDAYNRGLNSAYWIGGIGLVATSICFAKAIHYKKLYKQSLDFASIWQNEFDFGNGNSLALGVDAINDRVNHKKTMGVGVRYNF